MKSQEKVAHILSTAGIALNGPKATDIQINDEQVWGRVLGGGSLALGETFMDGLWDVEDLAGLVDTVYRAKLYKQLVSFDALPLIVRGIFQNLQNRTRAFTVAQAHYDLGNDLYTKMLDTRMVYTSGIWEGVQTLEAAQEQKLERLCQLIGLKTGGSVLDIGCGWGSFMKYAAERHQASVIGLTVSVGQTELGEKMCAGLPVEFVIGDYRDYNRAEKFDHVVSVEMIEAVGAKNLRTYFEKAHSLLKPTGFFGLQAIMSIDPKPVPDVWIDRYIFPNGILPSLPQIEKAIRGLFVIESMQNYADDYDKTLMEWWRRFDASYEQLKAANPKYDERFYRMWKFYLQGCAGLFRANEVQVCQILLRPIN
jgi:cyclopropane-fatty-acyl-phospholipid synthase